MHIITKYPRVLRTISLILTALILIYPFHLTLAYHTIESISAIPYFDLFALLYVSWLTILCILMVNVDQSDSALMFDVILFSLVFIGTWLLTQTYSPLRYDGLGNAAAVKYLGQSGSLPPQVDPLSSYFAFPGMHIFAGVLWELTGASLITAIRISILSSLILVSSLTFLFFRFLLKDSRLGAFTVCLLLQGDLIFSRYSFYPGIWALAFFLSIMLLVCRSRSLLSQRRADQLMFLTLLSGLVLTHMVTTVALSLVLVAILIVYIFARLNGTYFIFTKGTLVVLGLLETAWLLIWAYTWSRPIIIEVLTYNPLESNFLAYISNIEHTYLGPMVPLWAIVLRYTWIAILFGPGTIAGGWFLLRIKRVTWRELISAGGLTGVIVLELIETPLSPGGSEYYRILLYGGFFSLPVFILFLTRLGSRSRRIIMMGLFCAFFLLSFPTFLANNNSVSTSTYYRSELQPMNYLLSNYRESQLPLFDMGAQGQLLFFVPELPSVQPLFPNLISNVSTLWTSIFHFVASFQTSPHNSLLVSSYRETTNIQDVFGVPSNDKNWNLLRQQLSLSSVVYDDGKLQMYYQYGP
jgi:hypothetical protein